MPILIPDTFRYLLKINGFIFHDTVADKRFAGEVLGAVECHVFEEVCESALVIFLKYGTYFLYDMELRPVLGLPVAQQIVCQSVVELTVSYVFASMIISSVAAPFTIIELVKRFT